MRKLNFLIAIAIISAAFQISSCGNADKKTNTEKETSTDTVVTKNKIEPSSRPAEEKPPTTDPGAGTTGIIPPKTPKDDILANIDQYLVSTATIPSPANEGIQNASVSIKNTLSDVTFQKVIVEVSILTNEGAEFRTDYYVLQNVEPGETEKIKIPNATRGKSIVCHIVKLKSQELTNGEMVLVGHRVTAK